MKQRGINHSENRRRCTDSQSDCQNYDRGEATRFSQYTHAEAQILKKDIDEISGNRFAAFLLETLRASELEPRASLRFGTGYSRTLKKVGPMLHMRAKFVLEIVFGLGPMEEPRRQRMKIRDQFHLGEEDNFLRIS